MSFRGRLTLFFVLIVIVPMVSVTVVMFSLIANNEKGKANAAVAARLDDRDAPRARGAATRPSAPARLVGGDVALSTALRQARQRRAPSAGPRCSSTGCGSRGC